MPQPESIVSDSTIATQAPLCSTSTPPTNPSSSASSTAKKQRRGFTACPRWVDGAIAEHTANAFLRGLAMRLALLLFDRADNHTGQTRTLTYPQLARRLEVSADSVARSVTILRAIGACHTTYKYFERRRVGMRYTMHRHALTKTAGQRSQDLPLRTTKSTKSSSAPSAPLAPPPAAPICPIAETPWMFDTPVMAEMGEAYPRCQCHAPAPAVLDLEPEPAPVPQRELPLEADPRPTAPRPSDGQLRLPAYKLLDRQPVLSDEALLAAVTPIIAERYPGAPVSVERLARQLRIVRQRHDPDYREKQHRRDQTARRTTIGRTASSARDCTTIAAWAPYWAERSTPEQAARDEAIAEAARANWTGDHRAAG